MLRLHAVAYMMFSACTFFIPPLVSLSLLTSTHISKYKYKFINSTLCVGVFFDTDYAQICSYAWLINEALGVKPGNSACDVITSPCHPFSPSKGVTLDPFSDLYSSS